jgi:hypothetical protein
MAEADVGIDRRVVADDAVVVFDQLVSERWSAAIAIGNDPMAGRRQIRGVPRPHAVHVPNELMAEVLPDDDLY